MADFCLVCTEIGPRNIPLAGLDPAIHVLQLPRSCKRKTWVAGSSPAKGYLELSVSPNLQPNLPNRTAVGWDVSMANATQAGIRPVFSLYYQVTDAIRLNRRLCDTKRTKSDFFLRVLRVFVVNLTGSRDRH